MKTLIKHTLSILTLATAFIFAGCNETVDPTKVKAISTGIGYASGLAFNLVDKTPPEVKEKVCDVLTIIGASSIVVSSNETYQVKLVEHLKTQDQYKDNEQLLVVVSYVGTGFDYMFTKHPKWKEVSDVAVGAIKGFTEGFVAVYRPVVPSTTVATPNYMELADKEAFEEFKARLAEKK